MATSELRNELVTATEGCIELEDDSPDSLRVLVKKVNDLDDAGWMGLSENAQVWTNNAAKAMNNGTKLPKFGDEVEPIVEPPVEPFMPPVEPTSEQVVPVVEVVEEGSPAKKKRGVCTRIQELIVDHEEWDVAAIEEQLKEEGYKCSSSTIPKYLYSVKVILNILRKKERLVESSTIAPF